MAKERPIIFGGDNPKLTLEGRKTQTRRIVKFDPLDPYDYAGCAENLVRCPYGVAGDRLYVREKLLRGDDHGDHSWRYACDGKVIKLDYDDPRCGAMISWAHHKDGEICPSIHMPRWASRITLEILKVRVERLQDISVEDARAEGIIWDASPRLAYKQLWDSLHGKDAWDKNPWVWVIEFKKV